MTGRADTAGGSKAKGDVIAAAFLKACRAELTALKPGNVHVHAGGHGMEVGQFEAAAQAASRFIGAPDLSLGARVEAAVTHSMAAAGCNTNLGIILLCAPLAAAALRAENISLRKGVEAVLAGLDQNDANGVYAAIRRANPGGLGKSDEADVAGAPTLSLLEAMRLAAPRDRIAANYIFAFRDIFDDHLPTLKRIKSGDGKSAPPRPDDAVATLYMSLLARYPDSHIRRKFGMETAAHVQNLAQAARPWWVPAVSRSSHRELFELDRLLKDEGWNPGTTADFVVATLFAADIEISLEH